jgi:hypothetical protein
MNRLVKLSSKKLMDSKVTFSGSFQLKISKNTKPPFGYQFPAENFLLKTSRKIIFECHEFRQSIHQLIARFLSSFSRFFDPENVFKKYPQKL